MARTYEKTMAVVAIVAILGAVGVAWMFSQGAAPAAAAVAPAAPTAYKKVTVSLSNPTDGMTGSVVSGVTFGVTTPEGTVYNTTTPNDLTSVVGASDYWIGDDTTYYKVDIPWVTPSLGAGDESLVFGVTLPEVYKVGTMSTTADPSTFNTTARGYNQLLNVTASTTVVNTVLEGYYIEIIDPNGIITTTSSTVRAGGKCPADIQGKLGTNWLASGLQLGDIKHNQECDLELSFNYNSGMAANTYTFDIYKYDLNGLKAQNIPANLRDIWGTGATDDKVTVTVLFE